MNPRRNLVVGSVRAQIIRKMCIRDRGTPYQSDRHAMLSQAPIEVAPIDSVTVAREYAWDPSNMTEEERNNPLLAETLEKLSEDHDIIVEVIEE